MPTTLFFGEYPLTVDDKGRLLIPADVRKEMNPERDGEGFFLIVGSNHRPWLYPELGYQALVSTLTSELMPGDDMLEFDRMNFSMASRLNWDKQGRSVLPAKIIERTKLGRDVTMIGVRDHLELVNTDQWEIESAQLEARRAEIALRARQATREQAERPTRV